MRLDENGNITWLKESVNSGSTASRFLILTQDGGTLVGGSHAPPAGGGRPLVHKFKEDGQEEWTYLYKRSESSVDHLISLNELSFEEGFIACGKAQITSGAQMDAIFLKLDSGGALIWFEGSIVWARTIEGPNEDVVYGVIPTADGGFALSGNTVEPGSTHSDLWLIQLDQNLSYCGEKEIN